MHQEEVKYSPMFPEGEIHYPDMTPFYECNLFTFLDLFTKVVGPTARKSIKYQEDNPKNWERLMEKMEAIADKEGDGDKEKIGIQPLTLDEFLEMMKHWKSEIGIPRDLHAAVADFVPGMVNIFRLQDGAI